MKVFQIWRKREPVEALLRFPFSEREEANKVLLQGYLLV